MTCQPIRLPGGGTAIVCSSRRRQRCGCGRPATRLCDWRVEGKRSGTCDRPLCTSCASSPAPDKDLCAEHVRAFEQWRDARAAALAAQRAKIAAVPLPPAEQRPSFSARARKRAVAAARYGLRRQVEATVAAIRQAPSSILGDDLEKAWMADLDDRAERLVDELIELLRA